MASRSLKARQKGNECFKQVCRGGFAPVIRKSKFQKARRCYLDAVAMAENKDEEVSCYKNMAVLHFHWCLFEFEMASINPDNEALPKFHLVQSVEFNLQALHNAKSTKPQEWIDQVRNNLVNVIQWASEKSEPVSLLRSICNVFLGSAYKTACDAAFYAHKLLTECMFKQGVKEFSSDPAGSSQYKKCLNIMHDCQGPLAVAQELVSNLNAPKMLFDELKDLKEQVQLYISMCESIQARVKGDAFIRKALYEDEEIQMEYAWNAIDSYREAALLTREKDVENEALAMSRMGTIYSEVMKDTEKAHKCHFQATRLALSIVNICPRIVNEDWYIYSNKKVQEHQRQVQEKEDRKHKKDRAPMLLKLEAKLSILASKAAESAEALLKYIYEECPNPDPRKQHLGSLEKSLLKATLKKAIVHYHPDHNKQYGDEWRVLCEEIVKHLNRKYEHFKGE